jgi:hypothetical protein
MLANIDLQLLGIGIPAQTETLCQDIDFHPSQMPSRRSDHMMVVRTVRIRQ